MDAIIRSLGRECGIDARLARDGDRLSFPGSDGSKGSGVIELRKRTERAKQRGCRDAYRA